MVGWAAGVHIRPLEHSGFHSKYVLRDLGNVTNNRMDCSSGNIFFSTF